MQQSCLPSVISLVLRRNTSHLHHIKDYDRIHPQICIAKYVQRLEPRIGQRRLSRCMRCSGGSGAQWSEEVILGRWQLNPCHSRSHPS
ncbi:hypothetical protein IEO21_09922 [Rhodonia placenta]|uniref:Uncharacterized protein n=1 Tax=Rhodonia placenta TaxID=104341 RepID=A0A8H7TY08_9APHY|nr:hypothetical protein IEO21_09922 [Postia placenta]